MATTPSPEQLGTNYGNKLYELTRRRLSSGAAGNNRSLSRLYAGRGTGSTAMASAGRRLLEDTTRATADASLQSQLEGTQLGFQESGRLEGIRQFDEGLAQETRIAEMQAALERQLQERQFAFQREQERRQNKRGLLGSVFSGIGSLAGNYLLPGLGSLFSRDGGGGGSSQYNYSRPRGGF